MPKVRTTIELDDDLKSWHKQIYPEIPLNATINNLLRAYMEEHKINPPIDMYVNAARRLKDQLERELHGE